MQYNSGTLTDLNDTKRLRTNKVVGGFWQIPTIGTCFSFEAKPIDPDADMRVITTSKVVDFLEFSEEMILFKTESGSTYQLEISHNSH